MGNVKGGAIVFMRTQLKAKGNEVYQAFLDKLSPKEQKLFKTTIYGTTNPIEFSVKTCELGTAFLFPDIALEKRMMQFTYDLAFDQMRGVYKFFLRFSNPDFVIKEAARIRKTIHSTTKDTMIKGNDNHSADLVIEDYPDISWQFLTM